MSTSNWAAQAEQPTKRRSSLRLSRSPEKKPRFVSDPASNEASIASGSKEGQARSRSPEKRSRPGSGSGAGAGEAGAGAGTIKVERDGRQRNPRSEAERDRPLEDLLARDIGDRDSFRVSSHPFRQQRAQSPSSAHISSPSPSIEEESGDEDDEYRDDSRLMGQSASARLNDPRNPQSLQAPSTSSAFTQPRSSMAPTWATSAPSQSDLDTRGNSPTSSRSSGRLQAPTQLSTSAPSRIPSPPGHLSPNTQQVGPINPPLKTQAAFVGKLYAMLEDDDIANSGLIRWSADGTIFTCPNPTEFSKYVGAC